MQAGECCFGGEMTPCKKCGSYNIYAAWDENQMKYADFLVVCGECGNESRSTEGHREAWENWERENAIQN